MKKFCLALICLSGLCACNKSDNVLICDKYAVEITLSESGDTIDAVINGDAVVMNIVPSASGARYVGNLNDTVVELWNKGRDWTLTLNAEEPILCK